MENNKSDLLPLILEYKGRIIGALFGFILGMIFLATDIQRTIIFALIVVGGYLLGKSLDNQKDTLKEIINRIFSSKSGQYRGD